MAQVLVLAILLAGGPAPPAPTALMAGEVAAFDGVLVPESKMRELALEHAEVEALRAKLAAQDALRGSIVKACESAVEQAAARPFYDDPDANRWFGFFVGVGVGVGAMYGGAVLTGALPPPG